MGASIFWYTRKAKPLDVNGRSSFINFMERAFGSSPWTLDRKDIEKLEGLRIGTGENDAFAAMLEAIEKHDSITVDYGY